MTDRKLSVQEFLDMAKSEPIQVRPKRKPTTYNPDNSSYEWKIPGSCMPDWKHSREAVWTRLGQKRKAETQTPGELMVVPQPQQLPAHVIQLVLKWAIWYRNGLSIRRRRHRRDAISIPSDQIDRFLYESQFVNDN
jgi:hypothetical protein